MIWVLITLIGFFSLTAGIIFLAISNQANDEDDTLSVVFSPGGIV